jgi:spore coat protein A
MQFRVSSAKAADSSALPRELVPVPKIPESQAVQTRLLTLNEYVNKAGNPVMLLLNGMHWGEPITEKPVLGSTEIWTLINPTNDSHPIHLHLVRFQILDRQSYVPWLFQTKRQLQFLGPAQPPEPNEAGWKDTVRADPHMVTRIIVPFTGFTGRYVWHCHILEHEDNEMMRPYRLVTSMLRPTSRQGREKWGNPIFRHCREVKGLKQREHRGAQRKSGSKRGREARLAESFQ